MSDIKWAADKVQRRQLSELIPYDRNSKLHPDSQIDQLANSIREWGWTIPILIDESDTVLAGHGRLYAAQKLGLTDVPCMVAEGWSEEKKKAYVIADNKLAEKGGWDNALLYSELKQINDSSFDLALMGMEDDFKLMDFSPSLQPMTNFGEVTNSDMDNANNNIEESFSERGKDISQNGQEVICPNCSHMFRFEGR